MIKETTILSGQDDTQTYDSVDAFFTAHGLEDWRAKELKLFTDAGFDVTDSAKQQVSLNEDGTKVVITVAYADQAEKDSIFENVVAGDGPDALVEELSEDHLF
tara:strand:- start:233 stop:541 length:309 start_codon:yes stop_codon:yes gene_type:complete